MSGLGLGLGLGLGSGGGGGYDAATVTYLAAMGANQPTAAQAAAINARIVAIKARTGLWDKLYALYFLDIHNAAAALINVKTQGHSTAQTQTARLPVMLATFPMAIMSISTQVSTSSVS